MPDDPCVALVAEQQDLLDQQEAASILLEAAQLILDNISYNLMINAMNQAENGCNSGGGMMMATADPMLRPDNFNKHAIANRGLQKLMADIRTADSNVTAK